MRRVIGGPVFALVLLAVAAMVAGCGSDSTAPNGSTAALVGTYDLVSLTLQGQPTLTPPTATGVLTLSDSTYLLTITIPPPTGQLVDSGTYSVSGSNWSQTSNVQQEQAVGTYTFSNGTLSVNVSTFGMQLASVWQKRS